MKMKSTQILKFFTILVSSSILCAPCFSDSPQTPTEIKQNQGPVTIQETLERAYMQNAELDAARAGLRAQDENVSQANADWRPSLSVAGEQDLTQTSPIGNRNPGQSGFKNHSSTTKYNAGITQNVYKGGATDAKISQEISNVLQGKAGLFVTEQKTLNDAVSAHTSVTASEDVLNYRRQSENFYKERVDNLRARFEVGEGTYTDLVLMEANYEEAKADVADAIRDLEVAKATYLRQIGNPPGKLVPANVLTDIPKKYEEALEVAKVKNPSIIQSQYALEAAQYAVRVAIAGLLPTVDVNANVGNGRNGSGTAGGFGSSVTKQTNFGFQTLVNVPLYKQGLPSSQIRQAYQTVAQQKVTLVGTTRQVGLDVRTAWEQLISARETVKFRIASVKAYELAVEGALEEASVGTKSYVDVVEVQQNLIQEQINLVNDQRTLITASYTVLSAMGRLTARDLSLKVKYYDPDAYYNEYKDAWIQFWQGDDLRYVRDGDSSQ